MTAVSDNTNGSGVGVKMECLCFERFIDDIYCVRSLQLQNEVVCVELFARIRPDADTIVHTYEHTTHADEGPEMPETLDCVFVHSEIETKITDAVVGACQ